MPKSNTHHGHVGQWPEYSGFKPIKRDPCEIRLLYLDHRGHEGALHYVLRHVELRSPVEYHALSYSWGAPVPTSALREIFIHGHSVKIRPTLRSCLETMARHRPQVGLWIDALGINQRDADERNYQVSIMPDIFKLAQEVYVWLGPGDDDTNYALDHLAATAAQTPFDANVFSFCAAKLFKAPYWSRRWVIREFALARELIIVCGEYLSPWHRFTAMMNDEALGSDAGAQTTFNDFRDMRVLEIRAQTPLLDLMERFKDAGCVDPRDRVFSLLGIAKDAVQLRPRYDETQADLFFRLLSILPTERVLPAMLGYRWPHKEGTRVRTLMQVTKEDLLQSLNANPDDRIYSAFENIGIISNVVGTESQSLLIPRSGFSYFPLSVRLQNGVATFHGTEGLQPGDLVYSIQTTQNSLQYLYIAFRPGADNHNIVGMLLIGSESRTVALWAHLGFDEQALRSIHRTFSQGVLKCARNNQTSRILCHINRRTLVLLWLLEVGNAADLLETLPDMESQPFWTTLPCEGAPNDQSPTRVNVATLARDTDVVEILPTNCFSGERSFWTEDIPLPWTFPRPESIHSGYPSVRRFLTKTQRLSSISVKDELRTGLSYAAADGLAGFTLHFISTGDRDLHFTDTGRSPLCFAAYHGHDEIVKTLLQFGAPIETSSCSALAEACAGGHEKVVARLLLKGAKVNCNPSWEQPLVAACYGGNENIVRLLISRGAKVGYEMGSNALYAACKQGHHQIVQILLEGGVAHDVERWTKDRRDGDYPKTALMAASAAGYDKIVSILLDDAVVLYPVHDSHIPGAVVVASRAGHAKIVEMLLACRKRRHWPTDSLVRTLEKSLRLASAHGETNVVQVLLSSELYNTEPDVDLGVALSNACINGHEAVVRLLLQAKGAVGFDDAYDETLALYRAYKAGHEGFVRLLSVHGARVHFFGKSLHFCPIRAAKRRGYENIVQMLLETGEPGEWQDCIPKEDEATTDDGPLAHVREGRSDARHKGDRGRRVKRRQSSGTRSRRDLSYNSRFEESSSSSSPDERRLRSNSAFRGRSQSSMSSERGSSSDRCNRTRLMTDLLFRRDFSPESDLSDVPSAPIDPSQLSASLQPKLWTEDPGGESL